MARKFIGGPFNNQMRVVDEVSLGVAIQITLDDGKPLTPRRWAIYRLVGNEMKYCGDGDHPACLVDAHKKLDTEAWAFDRWASLCGNLDIARGVPTDQMADNTATPAREDQVYDKALERLTQWESNPEERQALVDDDIEPPTPEAIKRAKKSIYRLQARQGKGWPPITFNGVGMGSDGEVCVYYRVGRFDIDERAFKTGMVEIFAFDNATHKLVAVYDWYGYCMRGPVGGHIAVQCLGPNHKMMVNLFDAIRQEGQKWDFNKARGAFPWKPGDPTAVQIIDEMRGE